MLNGYINYLFCGTEAGVEHKLGTVYETHWDKTILDNPLILEIRTLSYVKRIQYYE